MAEQVSTEAELRALRHAADAGDWNAARDASLRLLRRLSAPHALELARQQVARRLPAFERHQPGVPWPRDFLESLRTEDPAGEGEKKWPWEEDEFAGPGANNFIRGVDHLWEARRALRRDWERAADLLVEAIATAIMAEKLEAWGARHPEQWRSWYQSASEGESDPRRYDVLVACAQDPQSVRIQRESWHDVADRLTEALG